jgi:hypothetical protein
MCSCKPESHDRPRVEFWAQSEPNNLPKIEIFKKDKEPNWKSKTTVLIGGDIPQSRWRLVPFSLRKLCAQIPDLNNRSIVILHRQEDYGNPKALPELAVYNPRTFDLAFNGGDYSWPLRIYLGPNWCDKHKQ